MRHYAFFRNYANYPLRAELCDFASAHNSGSPVNSADLEKISNNKCYRVRFLLNLICIHDIFQGISLCSAGADIDNG